jgi:hypothetical protein
MLATLAALAVALTGAATPVKVTLSGLTHAPKVRVRNYYTVRATRGGKPVAARLTEVMVDPLGGKHPVTYGTTSKPIANRPFHGAFRDFILFPASGRGVPLTFRVTVVVGKTKRTIDYKVTPRA